MSRGTSSFNSEASKLEVSPVLLVKVIGIPMWNDPSTTESLYLTDAQTAQTFQGQAYTPCALTYDEVTVSTSNEIDQCKLRIDNVSNDFTSLAKDYDINSTQRVVVLRGFLETLSSSDGAQTLFEGHIESCVIGEYHFEALVQADFSLRVRVPRRLYWPAEFPHLPSSKDPRYLSLK
jgi:hypothetical protein